MSGYACRLVVREVEARGLDPRPELARLRLDRDALDDPDLILPLNRALACLRVFSALTGDPDLGLAAGRRAEVGDFPAAGPLLRSCADLGSAHVAAQRHIDVWGPRQVTVELRDGALTIRLLDAPRLPRLLADLCLAAAATIFAEIVGPADPLRVRLRHRRPDDVSGYRAVFGRVPEFGARESALTHGCRPADPLPHADGIVTSALAPVVDEQARTARARTRSLTDRVRAIIAGQLADGSLTVATVACALAESERGLRRKLRAEGTGFADLLDEIRRELALHLLTDPRATVEQVARELGYADPATLSRAFQRWTGTTISLHRASGARTSRTSPGWTAGSTWSAAVSGPGTGGSPADFRLAGRGSTRR